MMPSTGSRRPSASLTDPMAKELIQGWLTIEKIELAFFSAASDLYEKATEVSSNETSESSAMPVIPKRGAPYLVIAAAPPWRGTAQHSMTFTARPPRAVSLYFELMSAPVRRIV